MQNDNLLKVGDRVIFDNSKITVFSKETDIDNKEIQQYRNIVLKGIDQQGIINNIGGTMATVSYPDGWDVPIPLKYLLPASQ